MKIIVKNGEDHREKEFPATLWKTLLSQMRSADVEMHSACNAGICGACICTIEQWGENINKSFRTEPWFPLAREEVMTCIAGISSLKWPDIILKKMY